MDLDQLRLLFDFGLLVLIWLVQLVIYPSFRYFQPPDLRTWHHRYTQQVTYVVFPLMVGQLTLASFQLWRDPSWYSITSMALILLLWASTFLQFVPLHNRIASADFDTPTLVQLVRLNWWRTLLWSSLFFLSFLYLSFT